MSQANPDDGSHDQSWAPHDYTDGRQEGQWQAFYPADARKCIFWEAMYLVVLFFGFLAAVFEIVYCTCTYATNGAGTGVSLSNQAFLGYLGAWVGGTLGGCSFGIKWMYHSVAKKMWHEDRRLWRLLAPHLSGVVSLFMVFLVASNLLQVFDKEFVNRPISVMAFSFLVGYFSDKALAKMAEVADTLFGVSEKAK